MTAMARSVAVEEVDASIAPPVGGGGRSHSRGEEAILSREPRERRGMTHLLILLLLLLPPRHPPSVSCRSREGCVWGKETVASGCLLAAVVMTASRILLCRLACPSLPSLRRCVGPLRFVRVCSVCEVRFFLMILITLNQDFHDIIRKDHWIDFFFILDMMDQIFVPLFLSWCTCAMFCPSLYIYLSYRRARHWSQHLARLGSNSWSVETKLGYSWVMLISLYDDGGRERMHAKLWLWMQLPANHIFPGLLKII